MWEYFRELAPHIALLQEVTGIPEDVRECYDIRTSNPITRAGLTQRFQSAMLVRGSIGDAIAFSSELDWVNDELRRFEPNLLAHMVSLGGLPPIAVVDVYAPAWPIDRDRLQGKDVSTVKLSMNPDVWVADILVAALKSERRDLSTDWIVGGDFNSCESFDRWKGGPRGNREWLDRMAALGFCETLRQHQGQLTPTFRGPGKTVPNCQIDHLFVSPELAGRLSGCQTGDAARVFGGKMSDHLPIIAEFRALDSRAVSNGP